ncbi:hypothetical protein B6U91_01940 [Candidatus Pacearchaeota archaeon ex4484_71]|nr:MAG: hypothetical protein B6U91_01940 [Candidatus Pacearchaeota archaeon ex4484_71]
MAKKEDKKKYITRREFVKYGAKVGAGALIGGGIGNLVGKRYKKASETIEDIKKPVKEVQDFYDESRDKVRKFFGMEKYEPKVKKEKEPEKEPEKISRRGFFSRIFNRYPIETSTSIGTAAGGLTAASRGRKDYVHAKKERETKERLERIEGKLDELLQKDGGLEKTVESESSDNINKMLLTWGLGGWIFSILFSAFKLTGGAISRSYLGKSAYIIPAIFIISLIMVFIGLRKKK